MKTAFFIAKRYFFTKKKKNFINIIANFSMGGVAVGTMSLIIVLSVFNGLEDLIRQIYGSFDPEIKIEASKGLTFAVSPELLKSIKSIKGVNIISEVLEDNALAKYKEEQQVVKIKGVSDNYPSQNQIEKLVTLGSFNLKDSTNSYAVVGRGLQYKLSIILKDEFIPLQIWYPRKIKAIPINPLDAFNRVNIQASGVFSIEKQYDEAYIFIPLAYAEKLMNQKGKRSALELNIKKGFSIEKVQKELKLKLGKEFKILNKDEQHAGLLKAVKIEKLFVFLTFAFIMAIASINIYFFLTMLAIEKQKDILILNAIGASRNFIVTIFIIEGMIIAFIGSFLGLFFGFIICFLQSVFGFISMGMQTSVVDAYPVLMELGDFILVITTIIMICLASSLGPALKASKYLSQKKI